jgi:hypothetical protein
LTSAKELGWLEDVHDDLCKMKVKGRGGKTKNREELRRIVQEVISHPDLQSQGERMVLCKSYQSTDFHIQ